MCAKALLSFIKIAALEDAIVINRSKVVSSWCASVTFLFLDNYRLNLRGNSACCYGTSSDDKVSRVTFSFNI